MLYEDTSKPVPGLADIQTCSQKEKKFGKLEKNDVEAPTKGDIDVPSKDNIKEPAKDIPDKPTKVDTEPIKEKLQTPGASYSISDAIEASAATSESAKAKGNGETAFIRIH
jgi:hypothetical protein